MPKNIGDQLKVIRKKQGFSQASLAAKAGMNTNAVAKIEQGVSEPTLATVKKLCRALGIKASDLLGY